MNKKGTTIVELIISLGLISIVLLFMIRLLIDINNANNNDAFAKDNQFNRIEIIRAIENDISSKKIVNITQNEDTNSIVINFLFSDSTSSHLTLGKDTLMYEVDSTSIKRKWVMKECSLDIKNIDFYLNRDLKNFSFVINIPVYTINDLNNMINNNIIDDITISYLGDSTILSEEVAKCLGKGCASNVE